MDKASAIFAGIGMLSSAYYLGYPLAWAAEKLNRVTAKFTSKSVMWQEFNRLSDALYGSPMPKIQWRGKQH